MRTSYQCLPHRHDAIVSCFILLLSFHLLPALLDYGHCHLDEERLSSPTIFMVVHAHSSSVTDTATATTAAHNGNNNKNNKHERNHLTSDLEAKIIERHNADVQSAYNHYSLSSNDLSTQDCLSSSSSSNFHTQNLKFQSISIPPKCLASIPDFSECFSNPCIHTTDPSTPLFTKEECQSVIQASHEYFQETNHGKWTVLQSGRYPVCGFWIRNVPKVHSWFKDMLKQRLFPVLCSLYPDFVDHVTDLVCDNAYLFRYTPETGQRTDVHTDSGCLSFTIALNDVDEYEGGGTWFDWVDDDEEEEKEKEKSLYHGKKGKVIHMTQGCVTFRPGGIRHRGESVTQGERYIIGGFVMHQTKVEKVRMLMGLGLDGWKEGKLQQAEEAFQAAIFLNPNFDAAYINLAQVLSKRNRQEEAMKVLEKVIQDVNPRNGEAAYSLGMMKKEKGDIQGAKECLDACLNADPYDVEAMMAQAVLCAQCHDRDGEKDWFVRVTETPGGVIKATTLASAYTNLGVIWGEQGDKEKEVEMYEKALQLDPCNFHARHSLALAYGEAQEFDQSIVEFKNAIHHVSNHMEKRRQVLTDLYRIVVMKVNHDPHIRNLQQHEIMERFTEYMGEDNYKELMMLMKQSQP